MHTDHKDGDIRVIADEYDQCGSCRHIAGCIFIGALASGVTELVEEITVDQCCFYAPMLTLIQGGLTLKGGNVELSEDE